MLSTVFLIFNLGFISISMAEIATPSGKQALEKKQYQSAYQSKGTDYKPRTEHFNSDGTPKYINRLIFEQSPYLIQHAHNPVNWYAWGSEAFAAAKRENKPIFLSIGYSTCHWCHVMERESFDNEAIADYLNKHFIAIKVDRERRPDVDKTYMTALTILKGSGGWPMSSLLTPEGKPFYAGTYFPPVAFMQILQQVTQLWSKEESNLRDIGDKVAAAVQQRQKGQQLAQHIGKQRIQIAVINLMNRFDELQGGFSQAPKFPNEADLFLLSDTVIRDPQQNQQVLEALKLTMDMMAQGGIYDQIGGGFHRYSTDNAWLVPHFEKMLYNQAHLVRTYLKLYAITHDDNYKRVVNQTLQYVLRELQDKNGVFYSAGDADSEGEEGKYFLWTLNEVQQTLNQQGEPDLAKLAVKLYGISKEGNFNENVPLEAIEHGNSGNTILNLPVSIAEFAKLNQLDLHKLYKDIDRIRNRLYQQRQSRIAPAIDKKIVTAWNGMMIGAFAQAGLQLKDNHYIDVAKRAGNYIWQVHHFDDQSAAGLSQHASGLWRVSLDGKASVPATQADYAYLAQAYVFLFDATQEQQWLDRSRQLTKEMIRNFWDEEAGNFFMSVQEQEVPLFSRPKDIYDGAIPSANAIALEVLSRLYYRTGEDDYQTKATAQIASLSSNIIQQPAAFSYFLKAVNELNRGEAATIQYGGKGHVRIETNLIAQSINNKKKQAIELEVKLTMDKGWHINSRYPLDKDLIATAVSINKESLDKKSKNQWKIKTIEYPQGDEVKLKLSDSPLSLYQKTITIKLLIESVDQLDKVNKVQFIPLQINYQTCSDSICLAPEMNTFYLFP